MRIGESSPPLTARSSMDMAAVRDHDGMASSSVLVPQRPATQIQSRHQGVNGDTRALPPQRQHFLASLRDLFLGCIRPPSQEDEYEMGGVGASRPVAGTAQQTLQKKYASLLTALQANVTAKLKEIGGNLDKKNLAQTGLSDSHMMPFILAAERVRNPQKSIFFFGCQDDLAAHIKNLKAQDGPAHFQAVVSAGDDLIHGVTADVVIDAEKKVSVIFIDSIISRPGRTPLPVDDKNLSQRLKEEATSIGCIEANTQASYIGCWVFAKSAAMKLAADPTLLADLHSQRLNGGAAEEGQIFVRNNGTEILPAVLLKHGESNKYLARNEGYSSVPVTSRKEGEKAEETLEKRYGRLKKYDVTMKKEMGRLRDTNMSIDHRRKSDYLRLNEALKQPEQFMQAVLDLQPQLKIDLSKSVEKNIEAYLAEGASSEDRKSVKHQLIGLWGVMTKDAARDANVKKMLPRIGAKGSEAGMVANDILQGMENWQSNQVY